MLPLTDQADAADGILAREIKCIYNFVSALGFACIPQNRNANRSGDRQRYISGVVRLGWRSDGGLAF